MLVPGANTVTVNGENALHLAIRTMLSPTRMTKANWSSLTNWNPSFFS